jgi:predicted alpha/beta-fold hydrolase
MQRLAEVVEGEGLSRRSSASSLAMASAWPDMLSEMAAQWRPWPSLEQKFSMTNWMTGVCEANGINIHYLRTGGTKPALVLLHGLTGSGACWSPLARALEGEYDVVMPDARGHGNSSTPLDGYRYEITQAMSLHSSKGSELPLRFC